MPPPMSIFRGDTKSKYSLFADGVHIIPGGRAGVREV